MTWLGERRTWLGVDTETGGLDWWRDRLRTVQIGDTETGWTIPWEQWGGVAKEAIESYTGLTTMHNSKFDLHFLEHNGVKYPRANLHDTMPMVGLLEPALRKGLKPASERHVLKGAAHGGRELNKIKSKGKWTWDTIPIDIPEYWIYAALDPVLTARLAEGLYGPLINGGFKKAYDTEVALAQVLCDMENRGMLVDLEYSRLMSDYLMSEEEVLLHWFKTVGLHEPMSDAKSIKWFQSKGHRFTKTTKKGNISFDGDVLEEIEESGIWYGEIAKAIIRLREVHKTRVTYFDSFMEFADDNARIHTSINPMEAITARMSSERPNMQNVPARHNGKMVRDAFYAPEGSKLISADFDQIEYRIMVCRAGEQQLIDAINGGQDLHTYMTSVVYNKPYESVQPAERSIMKNATFAFLYGAGDVKFALMSGITIGDAHSFRVMYNEKFPAIANYSKTVNDIAASKGWMETPYLGRKQVVRNRDQSYKLLNYVTQGEAGDVLKAKMVELSNTDAGQYMTLPIHDEILFEVPDEEAEEVKRIIEAVMPENDAFDVNLSVGADIISKWGDKYE
jgi:DNA polymerase-1